MRYEGSEIRRRERSGTLLGFGLLVAYAATGAFGATGESGSGGIVTGRTQKSCTDLQSSSTSNAIPVASRVSTDGSFKMTGSSAQIDALKAGLGYSGTDPLVVEDATEVLATGTNYQLSIPVSAASGLAFAFSGGPLSCSPTGGSGGIISASSSGTSVTTTTTSTSVALDVQTVLSNPYTTFVLSISANDLSESVTLTFQSDGSALKISVVKLEVNS